MARILVLGASGMVGHVVRVQLSDIGHNVLSVARSNSPDWESLDVESEAGLRSCIDKAEPEVVVNCIGVLIKGSEEDPMRAIKLNALLPRMLESMGPELGFRLIHLSSDCVFSGANGPSREGDRCDADEVYGRTKVLGEVNNDRDLTIRTSYVGPEMKRSGSGLFHWFISQRGVVRGFGRAMWSGITTLELAKFIDHQVQHPLSGLIHLTNGEPISKHDLLTMIAEVWGRAEVKIERDDSKISDRSLLCTREDLRYRVPSYRQMLGELHEFMRKHIEMYRHYDE